MSKELIEKLAIKLGVITKFSKALAKIPALIEARENRLLKLEAMCKAYAEATREQDAKDAERYRWLCEETTNGYVEGKSGALVEINSNDGIEGKSAIDKAIDKTIASAPKKGE